MAKRGKTKKQKIILVFDEKKRKEYLTGFSKRKNERKKKAQEDLKLQLKEEAQRIKQEAKESTKKMTKSYQPIPEIDDYLEQEYETEAVSVKIVELSTSDMAQQNNWIGENRPQKHNDTDEEESNNGNNSITDTESPEIPGMELKPKMRVVKSLDTRSKQKAEKTSELPKSKKELHKIIQKQTLQSMKHSKIFQTKRKLDRLKDKKKFRKQLNIKMKFQKEKAKRKPENRFGTSTERSGKKEPRKRKSRR